MKRILFLFLALFFATDLLSQDNSFISRYNRVAIRLYKEVLTLHANQVFSPYFVVNDFAAMYLGAAGRTRAELGFYFGFSKNTENFLQDMRDFKEIGLRNKTLNARIESYVGVFIEDTLRKKILPSYISQLHNLLVDTLVFADLHSGMQQVKNALNNFVKHSGINLLPEPIFDMPVKFQGGILLMSSAMFSGNWQKNFVQIYRAPFYLDKYGRKTKSLNYLTVSGYFKYVQGPDYQVVELPYEGNNLSLLIILPNNGQDLFELQKKFSYDDFNLVAQGLTLQRLRIFLPALEITSFYTLKDSLSRQMPSLFRKGANLSKMIKKLVWVDQVYHAVVFRIEPETELPFVRFIDFQKEAELNKILFINHPFIFFVKDNRTGAILFIGHVYKPI